MSPGSEQPRSSGDVSTFRLYVTAKARPGHKPAFLAFGLAFMLGHIYWKFTSTRANDVDSRITWAALGEIPAAPPPTIYNLEPPESLRLQLQRGQECCSGGAQRLDLSDDGPLTPTSSHGDIQRTFGDRLPEDEIAKYPKDFPYTLHNTDQFALSDIIHLRVNHLIALTPIPATSPPSPPRVDLADFIHINLDFISFPRACTQYCGHPSTVAASINRTEINRGVERWLRDAVAKLAKRRPYPSLILSLSRLGQDFDSGFIGDNILSDLKDDIIFLGVEGESVETQGSDMALESMPGFAARRQLASTLALYENDSSISVLIPSWSTHGITLQTLVHQVMLQSRFCLQPPGDSATRKGYWETILLGCIPVVFRRGTYAKVWRGLGVEWDQVALFIDEKAFLEEGSDIVEILRVVPEADVRSRQRTIAKLAARMLYAIPSDAPDEGWSHDAFGMVLRRLDRIKQGGRK
ncbi:hypothetical protein RQP46_002214 [Phenoliferia psychrophenolica]